MGLSIINMENESKAFVVTEVEYPLFPNLFVCVRESEAERPTERNEE